MNVAHMKIPFYYKDGNKLSIGGLKKRYQYIQKKAIVFARQSAKARFAQEYMSEICCTD